jgi:hypothetical protein
MDMLILSSNMGNIGNIINQINFLQAAGGYLHHVFSQPVPGFMNAWGINKDNLALIRSINSLQAVPGGLRLIRDDSNFFSYYGIYQSRFAYIRPTYYANKS